MMPGGSGEDRQDDPSLPPNESHLCLLLKEEAVNPISGEVAPESDPAPLPPELLDLLSLMFNASRLMAGDVEVTVGENAGIVRA
jgi:hypothetical protein